MIDQVDELLLEHFGTKGMKWGQRRAQKRAVKADKQWQKNIYTIKGAVDIHNNVADRMNNGGIARLNARHPKAHLDHDTPATRAYLKDYENLSKQFTAEAVKQVHGTSPSGSLKATLGMSGGELAIKVVPTDARHAAEPIPSLTMQLVVENGKIVLVKNVKVEVLAQSTDVNEFLQHYGKKGMKWGVRSARSRVKVSSDFKSTAPHRGKRASSLTNKQLKAVNERMNLEQNYKRMNPSKIKVGLVTAGTILTVAKLGQESYNLVNSAAGKAAIAAGKKALQKKL